MDKIQEAFEADLMKQFEGMKMPLALLNKDDNGNYILFATAIAWTWFESGYKAGQAEHMEAVKYATGWDEADLDQVGGISDCIRVLADARDEQIKIVEQIKCCGCCKHVRVRAEDWIPIVSCWEHGETMLDAVKDCWEARE